MNHLINIFLEPGKVFAELREKPTFLLPLLLMGALSAGMILMYFGKVDSDWFIDHTLTASGKEMSAKELAEAKKMMPSAKVQGYFGAPFAFVGVAIFALLMALYYMLAGRISGVAVSFRQGLSLMAWASMPTLIGLVIALVGTFTMSPQTTLESLALTRFDPMIVQLPYDHAWSSLAKNFDLLTFWSIFLSALGWRIWGKTSWMQAIVIAVIPSALIFGVMALFAMT